MYNIESICNIIKSVLYTNSGMGKKVNVIRDVPPSTVTKPLEFSTQSCNLINSILDKVPTALREAETAKSSDLTTGRD